MSDLLGCRILENQILTLTLEGQFEQELDRIFGEEWPFKRYTFDYYDASVELKGAQDSWVPTREQLDAVLAIGFYQGWVVWESQEGRELFFTTPKCP